VKQLWLNGWGWEPVKSPGPRPEPQDRDAEHRWENEGGIPPLTEPPDANPSKQL